jgi:hypothetical protein
VIAGAISRSGKCLAGLLLCFGMVAASTSPSYAARVTGTFKGYENNTSQKGVYVHFENAVTRDIYMALTADDGSFGTELPPGVYRLRSDRGAVLTGPIAVGTADASLGQVSDRAPCAPARLFNRQYLEPVELTSPAPSTASIGTADTTSPLPPVAAGITGPLDLSNTPAGRAAVE